MGAPLRSLALLVALSAAPSLAAPRDHAFTWTSATTPEGESDFQVWSTPRLGRYANFARVENRLGWSFGVHSRLETLLFLDVAPEASGPLYDSRFDGRVASAWHVRLSDPQDDGLGFSVLGEVAVGLRSFDLEARLIVDKNWGPFSVALNVSAAHAFFYGTTGSSNTWVEESLAATYRIPAGFGMGFEFRSRLSFRRERRLGNAFMVGPNLSFQSKNFWVAFSFLPQVAAIKGPDSVGDGEPLELRDNERFVGRLTLGVSPWW